MTMDQDTIEIELNKDGTLVAVKGCCKAKDFKKQISKLKEVLGA